MNECPNCGKRNVETNVFCTYCGSRIRSSDTAQEEIANIRGILGDLVERIDYLEEQLVDVNDKSSTSYTPMHTSKEIEAVGSLEKKWN